MKELKINEEHLREALGAIENLMKVLEEDAKVLRNKEADIFVRYMAYQRASFIAVTHIWILSAAKQMMVAGNHLNHPIFKTEESLKNGWGKFDLEGCEFFKSQDEEKETEKNTGSQ